MNVSCFPQNPGVKTATALRLPAALTRGGFFSRPESIDQKVKNQYTDQKRHEQALENSINIYLSQIRPYSTVFAARYSLSRAEGRLRFYVFQIRSVYSSMLPHSCSFFLIR
jgi:hypothetical protein